MAELMEQAIQTYNNANAVADNTIQSYKSQLATLDNLQNTSRIATLSGIISNIMATGAVLPKAVASWDVIKNSMFNLPGAENTYSNFLKANPSQVSLRGQTVSGDKVVETLPENRISDFSRRYLNDKDFRQTVENDKVIGDNNLPAVAEKAGIQGMTEQETKIALQYGRGYRTYGSLYKARNPQASNEEVQEIANKYATRIENGLQRDMNVARNPTLKEPNLVSRSVDNVKSKIGDYEPLRDIKEITRSERGSAGVQTEASSGRNMTSGTEDAIEMDDLRSLAPTEEGVDMEGAIPLEPLSGPEPVAISSARAEFFAGRSAPELDEFGLPRIPPPDPEPLPLTTPTPAPAPPVPEPVTEPSVPVPEPTSAPSSAPVPEPAPAPPEPTPVPEPAPASTAVEAPEATSSAVAETAESAGVTTAEEIGGVGATSIFELAGSVLNPLMLAGSLALLGFQMKDLFTKPSTPPAPSITYSQISEGV